MKPPHGPDIVSRAWEILRQDYGITEPQIDALLASANTQNLLQELKCLWELRIRRAMMQAEDELSAPPTLAEIFADIADGNDRY